MAITKFKLNNVEKNSRTDKILSGKYPILLDDQVFKYVFKHKTKGGDEFVEAALNYVKRFLSNPSNKHFGSHYDFDVQEAREEGVKSEKIATAKRMLADGMNLEKTSEYTGLSIELLRNLDK